MLNFRFWPKPAAASIGHLVQLTGRRPVACWALCLFFRCASPNPTISAEVRLLRGRRHAGRSRVVYEGIERRQLAYHIWKRDFFTSCINLSLPYAIGLALLLYTASFFFWATIWWWIWK